MIVCPKCSSPKSRVKELKSLPGFNRRYRICKECGEHFATKECHVIWRGHIKGWEEVRGPLEASE